MYSVIKDFVDLKDNNHVYRAGEKFPRAGAKVKEARLAELAGKNNLRGEPMIVEAKARRGKKNAD